MKIHKENSEMIIDGEAGLYLSRIKKEAGIGYGINSDAVICVDKNIENTTIKNWICYNPKYENKLVRKIMAMLYVFKNY